MVDCCQADLETSHGHLFEEKPLLRCKVCSCVEIDLTHGMLPVRGGLRKVELGL